MKRVNNFIEEMEDIIKKDFESKNTKEYDIYLISYTAINNNIKAYFNVSIFGGELFLFEVTHNCLYNEFIVYSYKLEDNYSVNC